VRRPGLTLVISPLLSLIYDQVGQWGVNQALNGTKAQQKLAAALTGGSVGCEEATAKTI
jgi:superfamily II DNA helicase RecQ